MRRVKLRQPEVSGNSQIRGGRGFTARRGLVAVTGRTIAFDSVFRKELSHNLLFQSVLPSPQPFPCKRGEGAKCSGRFTHPPRSVRRGIVLAPGGWDLLDGREPPRTIFSPRSQSTSFGPEESHSTFRGERRLRG